jgi:small-conductance mechanosensitive channel
MASTVVTASFRLRLNQSIYNNDWIYLSKTKNRHMMDSIINSVAFMSGVGTAIAISYNNTSLPFLVRWPLSVIGGFAVGGLSGFIASSPIAILVVGGSMIPAVVGEKMRKWFS